MVLKKKVNIDLTNLNSLIDAGIDYHKGLSSKIGELRNMVSYHLAYVALGGFYLERTIPGVKNAFAAAHWVGVCWFNPNNLMTILFLCFALTLCVSAYF
jgi:hypothetical protein